MGEEAAGRLVAQARQRIVSDILRISARRSPARAALIFEGQSDSFAALDRAVDRAANALRAAGVSEGDRVAIFSHNNRTLVILRFAIVRAGAIFTPINFMLNAAEVAFILAHSGASVLIAEDALCATGDAALAELPPMPVKAFIRHAGVAPPPGWIDAATWLDHGDDSPITCGRHEDDPVRSCTPAAPRRAPRACCSARAA